MRPFTRREKLALLRHQLSKAQTPEQFKEISGSLKRKRRRAAWWGSSWEDRKTLTDRTALLGHCRERLPKRSDFPPICCR